jgi:hypothetical protein
MEDRFERDTTPTGISRDYPEQLLDEEATSCRKRLERALLDQSFERFQFSVGKRVWKRADLYTRT